MHPSEIMSYYIGTGDCQAMSQLPDQSVHCVITSPPYWGLRDNSLCTCVQPTRKQDGTGNPTTAGFNARYKGETPAPPVKRKPKPACGKCGATRVDSQLGMEETVEEYVTHLVERFREVKRVLRDDGTLWINLGDCHAGVGGV